MKLFNSSNDIMVTAKKLDPTYPGTHPFVAKVDCDGCTEDLIIFMTKNATKVSFFCTECGAKNNLSIKAEDLRL